MLLIERLRKSNHQENSFDQRYMNVSENLIKIGGDFGAIFSKKAWAIVQGNFQNLAHF